MPVVRCMLRDGWDKMRKKRALELKKAALKVAAAAGRPRDADKLYGEFKKIYKKANGKSGG